MRGAGAEENRRSRTVSHVANALGELESHDFFGAVRNKKLALLVSDATRSEAREAVLEPLFSRLDEASSVSVYVCTGTHDPWMPENVELSQRLSALASGCQTRTRVELHDARQGRFEALGHTSRGTPIEVNASLRQCDLFLVVSDLKTHYFAGYSNPIKNYLPGLASLEAVRANHSLALHRDAACGRHPWHPDPSRRENPLANDMLEAFEQVTRDRPHHALCTLTDPGGIAWAGAGVTPEVTRRGFLEVDRRRMISVRPERYLIVSAGGHPLDESLYTAQRALELTRQGIQPGGEVLFLAECANGIGPPSARENFFERLQAPLDEVLVGLEREYVLYSHKAWKFADYLSRLERVSLVSRLEPEHVRSIHMEPVTAVQAQSVLERWQQEAGPGDRVLVVDDASRLQLTSDPGQVPMP
jgi:nickel-dependent lactate racemase